MRHLRSRLAVIGFLAVLTSHGLAADIKVVANPSVKADFISVGELRGVFLAETNKLNDGSRVEPVFEREGPVHEAFLQDFLRQTTSSLRNHYGELVFTGKASMPRSFNSDAEVLAYVARTRGAIGYVSSTAALNGVKALTVYQSEDERERRLISRAEPAYPDVLRNNGIGGTVRVQVTIASDGAVENVELLGGNPVLGDAAMTAIKRWVYAAGRSRTQTVVSIHFDASR
ncbi:MAG: TonB family protein [Terriglobales bacterium]